MAALYTRSDLVFLAKVAEAANRFEDMLEFMVKVASLDHGEGLTFEERKLFSNAFKIVITQLRNNWRVANGLEARELAKQSSTVLSLIQRHKTTIVHELEDYCHRILEHVERKFLPAATTPESKVFYHKTSGDYHRYLATHASGEDRRTLVQQSFESYKVAWQLADSQLTSTDPTRLGLALNFSVFYYELLDSPDRACHLAKHAFDTALERLDDIPEDNATDSIRLLHLLKDNLTLWMEDSEVAPRPCQKGHQEQTESGSGKGTIVM